MFLAERGHFHILAEHQGGHVLLGLSAMWLFGFRAVNSVQTDFDLLAFGVQHRDGVAVRDADAAGREGVGGKDKQEKYEGEKGAFHRRKWEMENPAGAGTAIPYTELIPWRDSYRLGFFQLQQYSRTLFFLQYA